jgi:hypothetical protein
MTHALQSKWIDAAGFEILYSLSHRTYWQWIAGTLPASVFDFRLIPPS